MLEKYCNLMFLAQCFSNTGDILFWKEALQTQMCRLHKATNEPQQFTLPPLNTLLHRVKRAAKKHHLHQTKLLCRGGGGQSAHPLSGHYMQHGLVAWAQRLYTIFSLRKWEKKEGREGGRESEFGWRCSIHTASRLRQGKQEEGEKADGGKSESEEWRGCKKILL